MKISAKRQVSIPKRVLETLKLRVGDEVDFEIRGETAVLVPIKTIRIPRDQAWYWTKDWQDKENAADEELAAGQYRDFEDFSALLKELHAQD